MGGERLGIAQRGQRVEELQFAAVEGLLQALQEEAPKQP